MWAPIVKIQGYCYLSTGSIYRNSTLLILILFKSALMSQLTRSFLLIYLYRRSLYGDCRASASDKWETFDLLCRKHFQIAGDLGKKTQTFLGLPCMSDQYVTERKFYIVFDRNILSTVAWTRKKFKTKWHCWNLVCVHCCVAMIKLITWMYGVFIIYVI